MAAAQQLPLRAVVGLYRSAADFRQQRARPAASDVRLSEKRSGVMVIQGEGMGRSKTLVPTDSVWGYVDAKGHRYRLFRGSEFQIQQLDTIVIYSSISANISSQQSGLGAGGPGARVYTAQHYFFSRGLNGLIFPLSQKYVRAMFEASSPVFAAAVRNIGPTQALSDYDKRAQSFRVVLLYRQSQGK
jgi:hypothetical protein